MVAIAILTILGILLGIVLTQKTGLRMGGVIVVPLLVVYSLYTFEALPLFLGTAILAYFAVSLVRKHTLIYGRQLLLVSLGTGAIIPLASVLIFDVWHIFRSGAEIAFFGTILPGIAVYNYHEVGAEDRRTDILTSLAAVAGLLLVGALLVRPTFATELSPRTTSILFTPASDIAQMNNAVRGNFAPTTALDRSWSLVLLFTGLVISETLYSRWGVRMPGLIAVPLLVILSLTNTWALRVFVVTASVIYITITLINYLTLIYGRVLLSIGLITGMICSIIVSVYFPVISGFTLYFTVLLAGIGAFNLHRVAPPERINAIALSTGLFAALLGVVRLFFKPDALGILTTVSLSYSVLLLGLIGVGGYSAYRLEKRRQPVAKHHARGTIA